MQIDIPEDILRTAGLTGSDCLIELAVTLYASRRLSYGQALRLSRLDRVTFDWEVARRRITLYTVDDLHEDVAALESLGRLCLSLKQ